MCKYSTCFYCSDKALVCAYKTKEKKKLKKKMQQFWKAHGADSLFWIHMLANAFSF